MMIPYLCPELPEQQKAALHYASKIPLIYTSVALRNWQAFKSLGIAQVYAPGSYFSSLSLNRSSISAIIGAHVRRTSRCSSIWCACRSSRVCRSAISIGPGGSDILATSFATFERNIRGQLTRILGPGGFDAARDITAITVNRWPHGYAYEYNPLFDPDWPQGQEPHVIGRARFGRIAIANSDAGAAAYTDSAIDQAYRAVRELS